MTKLFTLYELMNGPREWPAGGEGFLLRDAWAARLWEFRSALGHAVCAAWQTRLAQCVYKTASGFMVVPVGYAMSPAALLVCRVYKEPEGSGCDDLAVEWAAGVAYGTSPVL